MGLLETISAPLSKSLADDSQATAFATLDLTGIKPTTGPTTGVYEAGGAGDRSQNRILILPYCGVPATAQFSARVYGWRVISNLDGNPSGAVWIPHLVAEFNCTAGNRPGPGDNALRVIDAAHVMCDTITLVQGNLGVGGSINSTGPGTDLVAYATIDIFGSQFLQFDFQQIDPVPMNLLWAWA